MAMAANGGYKDKGKKPTRENAQARFSRLREFDRPYCQASLCVVGMDEAGRGPLAGPVVACAIALPEDIQVIGVNDSKKILENKREEVYQELIESALAVGIGIAEHSEIDEINILRATKKAFERAYEDIAQKLDPSPDTLLIDHIKDLEIPVRQILIVEGDAKSYRIAAASIVAKVTRDRIMREYDEIYPEYGFARHKGYGTPAHIETLRQHGACPIHRRSFIRNF